MPQHIAKPTGAGDFSQATAVGAATIWQAWADELQSTYAIQDASDKRVRVGFESLPADAATVSRVTVLGLCAGDGAGLLKLVQRLAGTDDLSAGSFAPLEGGYQLFSASFDTAPGGLPWTVARRNALQAGFDTITSADSGSPFNVDSVRLATEYATAVADDPDPEFDLELESAAPIDLDLGPAVFDLELPSASPIDLPLDD